MWKTKIAPLAVAFVAVGGIIAGLATVAAAGPLPGTGCPIGYVVAYTDQSYGGGATGNVRAGLRVKPWMADSSCVKARYRHRPR
ncbi:hypothetical protein GCM10010399_42310 [Dactylosporangium fulvum]|uniref:Secreted protein n=1 Tax=Dactylosporangium fulvum TaxID=53359 RepID=A0ABY5VX07_9ACTN|nr:hypothetical protein [Dactylosporangium fulvum]UWP81589.1 hypothetical protein Dfulv_41805 [Dactylosporangium fulvum]